LDYCVEPVSGGSDVRSGACEANGEIHNGIQNTDLRVL
jgi:hypothetical protein